MIIDNNAPEWKKNGLEPPEELKTNGFTAGYKPPAEYFNWFFSGTSRLLKELKQKLMVDVVDIKAKLSESADNAIKLKTPVMINDVEFDGSKDIIIEISEDSALLGNKVDKPAMKKLIIPPTGWVDCSMGSYTKQVEVEVSCLLAVDAFNAVVTLETEPIAQDCCLAANCGTEDGKIICYAEKIPTAEIVLEYYIIEGRKIGDGN